MFDQETARNLFPRIKLPEYKEIKTERYITRSWLQKKLEIK